ncbi:MAG: ArsR/SmtB family transcription factor [Anaerolineae bacterium]
MWARQTQVRLLKALAHPVRLQIVTLLCQGDQCVCHLRALVGKPQPYVSQQLAVLNRAGLVETTRDGLHIYYRVKDERVAELCALTREMAGQPSPEQDLPPTILGPVPGCGCPRCRSARQEQEGYR